MNTSLTFSYLDFQRINSERTSLKIYLKSTHKIIEYFVLFNKENHRHHISSLYCRKDTDTDLEFLQQKKKKERRLEMYE